MSTDTPTTAFDDAVARIRAGARVPDEARALYDALTDDERLFLLDGDTPFWAGMHGIFFEGYNLRPYPMGAVARLGIPGLQFVDGPRGVVVGRSTAFPVSMARGATWDVDLEGRVGRAIGAALRAQGGNFFGRVCLNLPRHPARGRAHRLADAPRVPPAALPPGGRRRCGRGGARLQRGRRRRGWAEPGAQVD